MDLPHQTWTINMKNVWAGNVKYYITNPNWSAQWRHANSWSFKYFGIMKSFVLLNICRGTPYYPENGVSYFPRKAGKYLQVYSAPYPIILEFSSPPLRKTLNFHVPYLIQNSPRLLADDLALSRLFLTPCLNFNTIRTFNTAPGVPICNILVASH